ncbi:MAG: hypothetical protein ABR903_05390 [Thermodesulfovibrionales bacterium]
MRETEGGERPFAGESIGYALDRGVSGHDAVIRIWRKKIFRGCLTT